jgi:AcrR family transcriptional regulator
MNTNVAPTLKGRPREFDVDEALAAALRVFWRKGFEAASMTDLTDAMGITRPSLYAAFGNKEALFRKALDLYEREKLAYVETALAAPTARAVAERLLRGALDISTSSCDPKGCLGVISTVACSEYAPSIKNEVLARRTSSEAALIGRFERARADGDLPSTVDPAGLARYVQAIMQGMSVQAAGGASREDLERLIETSLAVWPSA